MRGKREKGRVIKERSLEKVMLKLRSERGLGAYKAWRLREQSVQRSCGSQKLAPLRNL